MHQTLCHLATTTSQLPNTPILYLYCRGTAVLRAKAAHEHMLNYMYADFILLNEKF